MLSSFLILLSIGVGFVGIIEWHKYEILKNVFWQWLSSANTQLRTCVDIVSEKIDVDMAYNYNTNLAFKTLYKQMPIVDQYLKNPYYARTKEKYKNLKYEHVKKVALYFGLCLASGLLTELIK
jgi:hypothetical protein